MSIMLVGAFRWFSVITEELQNPEIHNLYCFNSERPEGLGGPVMSLLPFVDLIIFDPSSCGVSRLAPLRREAERLHIPFVYEL